MATTFYNVIFAKGKIITTAKAYISEAFVRIPLSIALVMLWGIKGAALAAVLAILPTSFVIQSKIFFKALNKLVIIYGATLPPPSQGTPQLKKVIYKYFTKTALCRVDLITLREKMSYQYVNELMDNASPVYLTGDLAFLETSAPDERVYEIMEQERIVDSKPIVGVTVSQNKVRVAFSDIKNYVHKEEKFISVIGQVIDHLIDELDAMVVFIPHCIVADDLERDDRVLARKVFQVIENKLKVKIIMNEYTAEELRGLTGKFDFCLGTRLHFIVDSCSMLVPSIMITNHDDYRTYGIFGEMLGQNKWIFNVEDMNYADLVEMIKKGWESRENTRTKLKVAIELAKRQTLENAKLLNDLIKRKNVKC